MQQFLDFSVELTCFTRFELLGTGQTEAYFDTAREIVGDRILDDLLLTYSAIGQNPDRITELRRQIFGDTKLGPVARAIAKLWYIGIWYELPRSWTEAYGARPHNTSFMVSATAYAEGLLWTAIGAHPPGAKAPGYGSWKDKPVIPAFAYGGSASAASASVASADAASPDSGPAVTQTTPGDVTPHALPKPQHPPPAAQGPSR
jgi:hypothetical protein